MSQQTLIIAGSPSKHVGQLLDSYGRPMDGTEFDSVLWSLLDEAGDAIGGHDQEEMIADDAWSFDGYYAVSEVRQIGLREIVLYTATPHAFRSGYIAMPRNVGLGTIPPNGTPTAIRTQGQGAVTPVHQCPTDWIGIEPGAELVAGVFELTIAGADNAIIGPTNALGRQNRTSVLEFLDDGLVIAKSIVRYQIQELMT